MPYFVKALWDADSGVFYSESNIPGLVVEASTLQAFEEVVDSLAPEMLAENLGIHGERVVIQLLSEKSIELAIA
jgi:hypothetical protein